MIKLILLLSGVSFFAISQLAVAQEAIDSSDPTRQLQNLVYYPHAQQFVLNPQFTTPLRDKTTGGNNDTTITYYQMTINATYGFSDRWRASIAETELFDQRNQNDSTNVTTHSNGFTSPQLTGVYRMLQNQEGGQYGDIELSVEPTIGTHKDADANQTGNNVADGWVVSVSAPFYWVKGHQEFMVEPQLSSHFNGKSENSANSTKYSSYVIPVVTLADRWHVSNEFYLEPILAIDLGYNYTSTNQTSGNSTTVTYNSWLTPEVQFGYLISPRAIATLALSYANHVHNNSPSNGNDTDINTNNTTATLASRITF